MKLNDATLRLFKSVLISSSAKRTKENYHDKTIKYGFVLSSNVVSDDIDNLIESIKSQISLSPEAMNSSFHKSWNKVATASIEQLVLEQVFHYLTTYGKEAGFFDCDFIYIPCERLEIPKLDIDNIPLVVIKGVTKHQLKEKLMHLLSSGIALSAQTIDDVVLIADSLKFNAKDLVLVKNKEVSCILHNRLGKIPENPVEFLRYVVYLTTNETLLIKNKALIEKIKASNTDISDYFEKYELNRLAEIFLRFKPLFLAFKSIDGMSPIINKIRKLADHHHIPMEEDYLNLVTSNIDSIKKQEFISKLDQYNVFRKIRLAYALKFRTTDADSILYRVRNGKSYVTDFSFDEKKKAESLLHTTLRSIAKDISKNVKHGNKTIYIPDFIDYTLPATEKQFSGNFPAGTRITTPSDMVFGIHWNNTEKRGRVDLDLSLLSLSDKYGWDGSYRSGNKDILFSGDMTDASNGASELFYIKNIKDNNYLVMVNDFNRFDDYDDNISKEAIPMQIFVGREKIANVKHNYMINPNSVLAIVNSTISDKQKILGLVSGNSFYFVETNIGSSISSRNSKLTEGSREYLLKYYVNSISLKTVLELAGYSIVNTKEKADIDFSPEAISKESILDILRA